MKNEKRGLAACGWGSVGLLVLLTLMVLFPACSQVKATTSAEAYVGVRAAPTIGLYLASDSVNMDMTPTSEGAFSAKTMKFGVETNSEAGYRVVMSTLGGTNSLVSTDPNKDDVKYTIPSITSETVGTNFDGNVWGYALGATDENASYQAVPAESGAEIVNTDSSTAGQRDEYNLTFGAHIDTSLPAGTYGNTVLVSVVANAEEVMDLHQVTYMQDVTPDICANTAEGVERQLYDIRDGKKYWVAKMKDGHCWMIQNLALDLKGGKTYTAADTDLANTATKSWTVPENRSTETEIPLPGAGNSSDVRSWNLGKIIYTQPTSREVCAQPEIPDNGYIYDKSGIGDMAYSGQSIVENCPDKYKDVEGWSDGFNATETTSYYENDITGVKMYDARYLIGNFYQYATATAGTGIGIVSPASAKTDEQDLVNATGSICPKGWNLPKSGQDTENKQLWAIDGSFTSLLVNYGYSLDSGWIVHAEMGLIGWPMINHENLNITPFYLVRVGRLSPALGRLNGSAMAELWSGTAYTGLTRAWHFLLGNTSQSNAYPAYHDARYLGMPIRCVSASLEQ